MIRSTRDLWAGIIYIFCGVSALFIARNYTMGTAFKMGPAYFPTVLSILLVAVGAFSVIRSFIIPGTPIGTFAFKALSLITTSIVVFGVFVRGAGVIIALPLLVIISAYASVKFRLRATMILAVALTLVCALVFLKGLGIPLPIIGPWLGG